MDLRRLTSFRFLVRLFALTLAAFAVWSCGGSGGSGNPGPKRVTATIHWGERSRALQGPSSALSVMIEMFGAGPEGRDFRWTVNRDADPAEHDQTATSSALAVPGTWQLRATFCAQPVSQGEVVGWAEGTVVVRADGRLDADLTTAGRVHSIEVPAGQEVEVGKPRDLAFSCRDKNGSVMAITPGSAVWSLDGPTSSLKFENGTAVGISPGPATVQARVEGVSSPWTSVSVIDAGSLPTVTISPTTVELLVGETRQFTAKVTGNPNREVDWVVVPAGGGTIDATGLYTAPSTPAEVQVEARSRAQPSQKATATVTVLARPPLVWIAFSQWVNDNGAEFESIFKVRSDGTARIRLTKEMRYDLYPSVSPNGRNIAFLRLNEGVSELVVMRSDGTAEKQMAVLPSSWGLRFRPDGQALSYTDEGQGYTMAVDGSGRTPIPNMGQIASRLSWSPTGDRVAYAETIGGQRSISTIRLDGSGKVRLTQPPPGASDFEPAWSGDGRRIAFTSNREEGKNHLFVMNSDGTGLRRLTRDVGLVGGPCWMPGDEWIVYHDIAKGELRRIRLDGMGDGTVIRGSGPRYPDAFRVTIP